MGLLVVLAKGSAAARSLRVEKIALRIESIRFIQASFCRNLLPISYPTWGANISFANRANERNDEGQGSCQKELMKL